MAGLETLIYMEKLNKNSNNTRAKNLFEDIVKVFGKDSNVMPAKMFGMPGLKIGRKMFAMSAKGKLVIKLPKERVEVLVNSKKENAFTISLTRVG